MVGTLDALAAQDEQAKLGVLGWQSRRHNTVTHTSQLSHAAQHSPAESQSCRHREEETLEWGAEILLELKSSMSFALVNLDNNDFMDLVSYNVQEPGTHTQHTGGRDVNGTHGGVTVQGVCR